MLTMVAGCMGVTGVTPHGDDHAGVVDADGLDQHERGRHDEIVEILERAGGSPDEGAATEDARRGADDITGIIDSESLAEVAARKRPEIEDRPARGPAHRTPHAGRVGGIADDVTPRVDGHRRARRVPWEGPQVLLGPLARPQDRVETEANVPRANRIAALVDPQRPTRLRAARARQHVDAPVRGPAHRTLS